MIIEKRNLVITAIIIGSIMVILSIVGFVVKSNESTSNNTTYTDPASGEQIIDSDKSPQGPEATHKNTIIYPGFSKLIDRGLSPVQIQSIQSTISEYSLQQDEKFKEVSLVVDSMEYVNSTEPGKTYALAFSIIVNRKDNYFVTVDPIGDTSVATKLFANDKTTLLIER